MSSSVFNTLRVISRVVPASTRAAGFISRNAARTLWSASSSKQLIVSPFSHKNGTPTCLCGNCRGMHTRGDKELVEFLVEEIAAEKKSSKARNMANLDGFDVRLDGAQVTLSKKFNDEIVEVIFNVNHSVDDVSEDALNEKADNPPQPEMKSRPSFEVKLIKGKKVTQLACSFIQEVAEAMDDGPNDVFSIDELMIYEGESDQKTYAVAGEILDGYMYDLLMNLLEERGVSNEFADKMSDLATKREHDLYVSLLESLQSFVQGK